MIYWPSGHLVVFFLFKKKNSFGWYIDRVTTVVFLLFDHWDVAAYGLTVVLEVLGVEVLVVVVDVVVLQLLLVVPVSVVMVLVRMVVVVL